MKTNMKKIIATVLIGALFGAAFIFGKGEGERAVYYQEKRCEDAALYVVSVEICMIDYTCSLDRLEYEVLLRQGSYGVENCSEWQASESLETTAVRAEALARKREWPSSEGNGEGTSDGLQESEMPGDESLSDDETEVHPR